jgi:NADH-quinone oxidoreductase subunit M
MGYIVVGLFAFQPIALAGSLYQMVNHGVASAGLFLIVGMLYERLHTRNLNEFGSLAKSVPMMAIAFMIMTLSSVALPGTNGFVGEFTILLGTFQQSAVLAGICGLGVIFGAVYSLKAFQKVMLGPSNVKGHGHAAHGHDDHSGHGHHEEPAHVAVTHDMNAKEITAMALLALFVFAVGFFPETFFAPSRIALETLSQSLTASVAP